MAKKQARKERTIGNYVLRLGLTYYQKQDWFTGKLHTTQDKSEAFVFNYREWAQHGQETLLSKQKINFEIIPV